MNLPRILGLCLASLIAAAAALAEPAPRPLTHEDLWLLKRVGSPFPSPDGAWVAFVVQNPSYDPKTQTAEIWVGAADGATAPRRLTHVTGTVSSPAWSHDSRKIAYTAKRDGDEFAQVYVLDLQNGGDSERITHAAGGARFPVWSPDGSSILFVGDVPPANVSTSKANVRTYDTFPIRYWDHWLDDKKPHLFVQEAKEGAKARDLIEGTRMGSLPGYGFRQSESGEDAGAVWTPDGKAIVFAATVDRDRGAYAETTVQLFSVPVGGGEPTALTQGPDSYGSPQILLDGRTLVAAVEKGGDGKIYHHTRLAAFPWPFKGSARRILTADLDLTVGRFAASADSRTVYFTAEESGHDRLFSVPVDGGAVKALGLPREGCLTGIASGAATLVASFDSASRPPEVVRIDLASGSFRTLTHFNDEKLAQLDLPKLESFTFTSGKGRTIESFLMRPAGFRPGSKYPLLVVMHGGPASQHRDGWSLRWNYDLLAAPGYVVLLTNYSGSTGYSEAFGQAIQLDPLKTPGDEINAAADAAIKRYPFIDATRQAAAGASYGGHLANWMEATTTRYRCLVAHAGLVNLESQWANSDSVYPREMMNGGPVWEQGSVWTEQNPVRFAGNHFKGTGWVTPILVSVGEKDARVPMNNSIENWTYLQRLQVPSRLLVFPDENHWITKGEDSRAWYGEVHAWLARWLK